jgi:hypothetical protein
MRSTTAVIRPSKVETRPTTAAKTKAGAMASDITRESWAAVYTGKYRNSRAVVVSLIPARGVSGPVGAGLSGVSSER